ncbi:MAG: hypothetical protein WAO28_03490 [Candidatus Microsaccharimonas sp.]
MSQDYAEHLKPAGGYLDIAKELLPDLSLDEVSALTDDPAWDAAIHIRYKGDEAKLARLMPVIEGKLQGRLPTSISGHELLIVDFYVENDSDDSVELVDDFSTKLAAAISGVVEVTETSTGIHSVLDETSRRPCESSTTKL